MIKNITLRIEVEQDTDKYGPHSIDYDLVKNETRGVIEGFPAALIDAISECIQEIRGLSYYVPNPTTDRAEE